MSLLDDIPGYRPAVEREELIRNVAFLPLPERICGFDVLPLTLRRLVLLEVMRSPFICATEVPKPCDVANFLWATSQSYRPGGGLTHWLHIKRCRKFRKLGMFSEACSQILGYVAESLQDAPPALSRKQDVAFYSYASATVGTFAREYGWTADYTMDLPLKIIFQQVKEMKQASNPKAVLFNPSDRIRGDWLKKMNAKPAFGAIRN